MGRKLNEVDLRLFVLYSSVPHQTREQNANYYVLVNDTEVWVNYPPFTTGAPPRQWIWKGSGWRQMVLERTTFSPVDYEQPWSACPHIEQLLTILKAKARG